MTSKGPSSVESPAPASPSRTRRGLLAAAALGGLGAVVAGRSVAAAPDGERPNQPTDADTERLAAALGLELTARDLYQARLDAGGLDDLAAAVEVMKENHEAYAQAIAGDAGLSLSDIGRDDDVFASLEAGFTSDVDTFAATAHELEQTAVSTHTALLGEYESADAIQLTGAIIVVEARHATVLADLLGVDDLDTVFGNEASALELSGGGA